MHTLVNTLMKAYPSITPTRFKSKIVNTASHSSSVKVNQKALFKLDRKTS